MNHPVEMFTAESSLWLSETGCETGREHSGKIIISELSIRKSDFHIKEIEVFIFPAYIRLYY